MKYIVKLDQKDIADIICKHFCLADPKDVHIEAGTITEGYGMSEHPVGYVKAEVEFDKDVCIKVPF